MLRIIKKFSTILNSKQKSKAVIIMIMMIIGAFTELIGVSLIYPIALAVMDPDIINTNKYAKLVCEILDIHSVNTFVIVVIIALVLIFILKNLFLLFEYSIQYRFVYNNRFRMQRKLIDTYLHRPYEYFLNASSGEIMRVVSGDTQGAFTLLTTVLSFLTEAVISILIVIMLFIINPLMTVLLALILGITMLIIAKIIKPILRKAGLSQQKHTAASNKWLLQSISGIKELKVAGKEEFFIESFARHGEKSNKADKMNALLGNLPRLMIETVSIAGMLSVVGIMIFMGVNLSNMIPQLAVMAMAAARLMPSVNRLSTAYNSMAYQEPMLDKLIENLQVAEKWELQKEVEDTEQKLDLAQSSHKALTLLDSIEMVHITYHYPNSKEYVFQDAELRIPIGKSIGLVGTSGAGKTTAVDILLGLLKPQKGEVFADGENIQSNYKDWLSHISYIPQMIYMLDDTIKANIAFGCEKDKISEEQVWTVLKEAKMDEFVKALPQGLETEIGERGVRLSGGQRQRIGIARALYTNPELLIFDEATSALDNETEAAIMESINNLHGKKTLIIIAHRLQTIEGCDLVYRVTRDGIQLER